MQALQIPIKIFWINSNINLFCILSFSLNIYEYPKYHYYQQYYNQQKEHAHTVDSCYLEHVLFQISHYLQLFSWSLQHLRSTSLQNVSNSTICYLDLIFWSLGRITVAISNFWENVAHRNQSMKIFSCVFERVCLIECYFNWFLNFFFFLIIRC